MGTLLDFQLSLVVLGESAILHSSTLCPLYDCRRTGPPHPTPRHTSNTCICLLRGRRAKLLHRRIDRAFLDFGCSRRTAVCGHGATWYSYVVSMYLGGGVSADTRYVCCSYGVVWGVEGRGGLPVRWHSYGGHRVEL